ncbi:MAG: nitrilase-related carbon-nitrogen hydrolase, partial [Alphaproteobacteria bacterium]
MSRIVNIAGAQLGPISRDESRQHVVARLLELMREAKGRGADLIVYPELALTTFFPRWWMEDEAEIDAWYEREMPSPATRPLFEVAREMGMGFYLGYAEIAIEDGKKRHYNTSILADKTGKIIGKYRKV